MNAMTADLIFMCGGSFKAVDQESSLVHDVEGTIATLESAKAVHGMEGCFGGLDHEKAAPRKRSFLEMEGK